MAWVKGQSGNPKGRPALTPELGPAIRKLLREKDESGQTNKEKVARALMVRALAGEIEAIKVVLDRVDGKVPSPVEMSGPGGEPLRVETFDYHAAIARIAARPDADSSPPGAAEGGGDGSAVGQDADGG